MLSFKPLIFLSLLLPALAVPTPTQALSPRASQCSQFTSTPTGAFTFQTNLWGQDKGQGQQCSTINSASSNSISWSTNWSWANNPSDVKSYTNALLNTKPVQLSAIKSMPTKWAWNYKGDSLQADVSYDAFLATSADPKATHTHEVMVWLGKQGDRSPITASPNPVASPTIGNSAFDLFKGTNSMDGSTVFSFVRSGADLTDYSGDLNAFLQYLVTSQGVPAAQYMLSMQAGTEAFTGSNAVFETTAYELSVATT